ncbi:hypothetical protein DPEC_G00204330 [Dallia pectoralis]|uniref:Uncharacterized protein n=1 Tax=Dallia pectoralis TaxID=75939 RepID=A0ACC2G9T1_DALPE|nr:hypothetical protein DPEC_G00204330 [Dallia pectoralis]
MHLTTSVWAPAHIIGMLLLCHVSDCLQMSVCPEKDVNVTVSSSLFDPLDQCPICTVSGGENGNKIMCDTSLVLIPDQNVTLLFNCTDPQSAFVIQIERNIECNTDSCSPATGAAQPSLFQEFNRTFEWALNVPDKTVLSLDFSGPGLKEMTESGLCPDGYQYTITITSTKGGVQSTTYCRNGPVTHLDIPSQTTVSLQVSNDVKVDSAIFTATPKPMKKDSQMISVTPEPNSNVTFRKDMNAKECNMCAGSICNDQTLEVNSSVEINCSPNVYNVEINRKIECKESCSMNIVQAESSLLSDFNRTFTWDLKGPAGRSFQLDFPSSGMRQIPPSKSCPDKLTYTIITYQRTGLATIGVFCKGGTITTVQGLFKGRVSLEVPGNQKLEPVEFNVTVGPEIKMWAVVKVDLPRGVSDTEFLSANFPRGFPSDSMMRWDFTVPGRHNYTINILDYTEPLCQKLGSTVPGQNEVKIEYDGKEGGVMDISSTLMDPQPTDSQGSFSMTLVNCVVNKTQPDLKLNFTVSVMRSSHPVVCAVNSPEDEGLTFHIENTGFDPDCEMRLDSVIQENITVLPGSNGNLSFLDCLTKSLSIIASKTLGCQSLDVCSLSETLTVPVMPSCLSAPLQSFTWHLNVPTYSTVDLLSPRGSLRQSLPGQECDGGLSFHLAEGDGSSIGYFCPDGIIRKVQVSSNISITATSKDLQQEDPFLNVSFSKDISESIIYTVQPKMGSPNFLATPSWPGGMKALSTVSWVVIVPPHLQAELLFTNMSQPKCGQRHTHITVQTRSSQEEIFSLDEGEVAVDKLMVSESFYLNLSNCLPEEGQFRVLSRVTLQKTSKLLLGGIIGAVGAVLLLLLVLPVAYFILRRKKRTPASEASIYMGKQSNFSPGQSVFPKTRPDNESHVYNSIEETQMYGHLLRDEDFVGGIQDHFQGPAGDSYRTFMAVPDGGPEIMETPADNERELDNVKDNNKLFPESTSFMPARPRTPIDRQDSMGFTDRRMVDTALGTFKSTGDINNISLSASD